MPKDAAVFTKAKPKGIINFRPFEQLDESSMREVQKYQVFPLGSIQEYCRHIPYNSGKKDFFEKTGRESFEVFQYVFRLPRDNTEYAVMWDYNVGLTTPAKMLNLNPGLKEITHSITGGSIMAQEAMIPIFGPDFPMRCIPPESPEHGRMIIDPAIILESTREAGHFRQMYNNTVMSADSPSPKRDRKVFKSVYDESRHHPRHRLRRPFLGYESPYGTDTEGEHSPVTDRGISDRFHYASIPPMDSHRVVSGWAPVGLPPYDQEAPAPSPWLSHPHHHHWRHAKRSADHIDPDRGYDGDESRNTTAPSTAATSPLEDRPVESTTLGSDKNAALLLMNLSVRDTGARRGGREGSGTASEMTTPVDAAFPRIKRSRASSM
ncbi:hypothetical protein KJ359_005918 [Pestalotiopsis sp. 9143b]|nr:hypothetical protein KJ359_005918 [Pestalotiopsis sp. 9143b]